MHLNFILFIGVSTLTFKQISGDQNAVVAIQNEPSDDVIVDDDENDNQEEFIPSNEWQKIKPGQSIPSGLHVKINLETGEKTAKVMENSGKISGHHYELHEDDDVASDKRKKPFSPQELKEALKKFKADEPDLVVDEDKVKEKFRSIEELKHEFRHLKMNVKSESEILSELTGRYRTATENDKAIILQDMEYLVHQYDTAQDFVKFNGLELLIPELNSTNSKIREMVAFVIGSAMQGNPSVQISLLEKNAMPKLLRLIAFDSSNLVRARALYAISCLVRQFPFAQKRLMENGGLNTFAELFKDSGPEMQILQLKVVVLLHDLVVEHQLALKYSTENKVIGKEKVHQYSKLNIISAIEENNFCQLVPTLLPSPDFDTQEKVVAAMLVLIDTCGSAFSYKLAMLKQLAESYKLLLAQDSDDYISSLYESVTNLIAKLEQTRKDEL